MGLFAKSFLNQTWAKWIEQFAGTDPSAIRVDSAEMAHSMILSGAGIGSIACIYADQSADLVRILPEAVLTARSYIVFHESMRNSAKVQAVIESLAAFFDARKDALNGASSGRRTSSRSAPT